MREAGRMDFAAITANLVLDRQGIWVSGEHSNISYPEKGNELCFNVENSSYWFRHRNECITTTLNNFPPPGTIFDVGGGNGFVSLALQNAGFDVVLVEPGVTGAANARNRGIKHVVCSTLEDAQFPPGRIPAVGVFDVVEHLRDDSGFLSEVHSLLIPEGRIYLTVPAYGVLWSDEDVFAQHMRRYTLSHIQKKLKDGGFTIDFASYVFAFLPLPIFLLRTIPSRLHFRKVSGAEGTEAEHRLPGWPIGAVIQKMLQMELTMLRRRQRIPFGGSCLVVGRKQ